MPGYAEEHLNAPVRCRLESGAMGRPSEQAGQEGKDLPRRHAGHSKPKVTRRIVGLSRPPEIPTRRSPRTLIELRQILNLNGATMMNKAIFLSVILAFLSWACAAPPTPARGKRRFCGGDELR